MYSWRMGVSYTKLVSAGYFEKNASGDWCRRQKTEWRRSAGSGTVSGATIDEALVAARAAVPKGAIDIFVWEIKSLGPIDVVSEVAGVSRL